MTTGEAHATADHHDEGHSHAVPAKVLLNVFLALVLLTVLTVVATQFPTGSFEIWISMGIATVKASLVVAYFMHLRYDKPFNAVIFVSAALFVMLFISLALMDTKHYEEDIIPGYAPAIEEARMSEDSG